MNKIVYHRFEWTSAYGVKAFSVLHAFIVLCLSSASGQARSEAEHLERFDLKKSIIFAIENSPSFDSLRRQLNISLLEEQSAEARWLPSLDLSATHGLLDSSPRKNRTPYSSDFNLGLTESLYDNGVSRTNQKIATLTKNEAEISFEDQKNRISLDVASQFVAYSLNIKLLEIQEKQLKLISRQNDMISKDYYQGVKTKNDFLRFKTQVSRSEIDVVTAKNIVEKSKQELQRLIGVNHASSLQIEFIPISLDSKKMDVFDSVPTLESHLQFKAAEIHKKINDLNVTLVSRKNLPEWLLSSGVNYTSSSYLGTGQSFSDNAQIGWNVLLTVKYNFLDWGIRSRDKQIALQKKMIQSNDLDSKLLALKSSLNQLQFDIKKIQKNFELAKELLSLEKSNIEFIEREYRNGKVQYLDLITGLNNLSDAQIKFYSAVSDLEIARYTLFYHQGKLYDEILK